jgi:hypothetical protein
MKGAITKEFFPSVEKRLAVNLNLNQSNNYFDRPWKYSIILTPIKIIGSPECPINTAYKQ